MQDALQWEKHVYIPILRNGCCTELACSKINGRDISLKSTCSFDSIVHITVVAALDYTEVRSKVLFDQVTSKLLIDSLYPLGIETIGNNDLYPTLSNLFSGDCT